MRKDRANPFEDGSEDLPPRGTGLETGNAGERRGGNPRTEEERAERHASFIAPGAIPPKSLSEQWAEYRKKKREK